jgi:hypothetical protein
MHLVDISSTSHNKQLPELLRTLYGILMLLPQSESYKILSNRLQACSALHSHLHYSSTTSIPVVMESSKMKVDKKIISDSGEKKSHSSVQADTKNNRLSSVDLNDLVEYFAVVYRTKHTADGHERRAISSVDDGGM